MNFRPGLLIKHDLALFRYPSLNASVEPVPEHIDYRWEMIESSNQGASPSCAGLAMAGYVEWWQWKYRRIRKQVDGQAIYDVAKTIDGQPDEEGTTLEAVVRAARQMDLIPVDMASLKVVRVDNVKAALHRYGPMLSGFIIHEGWEKATADGWINTSGNVLGGHAVVLTGYSDVDKPQHFDIQNSRGALYGWKGMARMQPGQFVTEFMYGVVFEVEKFTTMASAPTPAQY